MRLAVQRERVRSGICKLRQRKRVKELPEQCETRLAVDRENKKRCVEESREQRVTRLCVFVCHMTHKTSEK